MYISYQASAIYRLMGGNGQPIQINKLKGEDGIEARKDLVHESLKQYEPSLHEVLNTAYRPDKVVFVPNGEKDPITGADQLTKKLVPPARVALPIQKYIIKQKASFARGNGVKLRTSDQTSKVFKWVYNNWYKNKTDYYLTDIFKHWAAETQVAVVFFADKKDVREGQKADDKASKVRLRFKILAPSKGDYMQAYFDPETEELTGLLREYEDGDGKTRYDLYLAANPDAEEEHLRTSKPVLRKFSEADIESGSYEEIELPYPKLPLVYWDKDTPECEDVHEAIKELETGFSDFLTQQGYTADPVLFVRGTALSMPAKGAAGKLLEGSVDADAKYLTPENATESRELQFELLQKYIFSLNRAVILDLDTMKNLSDVSGAALDRYLIDCYQEATDNQTGYWGLGVQRMVNVQLAFAKFLLGVEDDGTTIDVEFTKYRIDDVRETVEVLTMANGGKPLIDWESSVGAAGLADDPQTSYDKMQQEAQEAQEMQGGSGGSGQDPEAEAAQRRAAAAGNGDRILEGDGN